MTTWDAYRLIPLSCAGGLPEDIAFLWAVAGCPALYATWPEARRWARANGVGYCLMTIENIQEAVVSEETPPATRTWYICGTPVLVDTRVGCLDWCRENRVSPLLVTCVGPTPAYPTEDSLYD